MKKDVRKEFSFGSSSKKTSATKAKKKTVKKNNKKKGFEVKSNLISSFALAFLYCFIILGIVFAAPFVLPSLFKNPDGSMKALFFWWIGIGTILFLTLPFYLTVKRMETKAVPQQKFTGKQRTIAALKKMNSKKYPFEIVEDPKYDLLLRFKLTDQKWVDLMAGKGFKKAYWLYLKLDQKTRTVYCAEKTRSVEWEYEVSIEEASAHIEWGWFYGIILADTDKIWESDDFKSFEKIEDESYSVGETKWPVFNALLKNGWKIKPRVLPQQVRKKRA